MRWEKQRIGDITHVVTKGTTPTKDQGFAGSGINFIKAEALNGDSALDPKGIFYITEDVHQKLKRSILQEDDVLLTIAGAQIGRCGIVRSWHLPANTNQAVGIMRVDRFKADPSYIYYWFKQKHTFAFIQGLNAQAAQPNINLSMLKNIEVPLPPVPSQRTIASTLSAYDDLIKNNRRRIHLLEQSARLLYKEWFVHLRFPGHEHVQIKDGVPEVWEKKPLSSVATINDENLSKPYEGEVDYIDISAVSPGHINSTKRYDFKEAPSRARRIVQHQDLIWSCVRPNRKSYAVIWNPTSTLIASTGFAVIRPRSVPVSFLEQATTTPEFVGYLENNAKGAAYPAVVAGDFERAELIIPTTILLDEFDMIASTMIKQRSLLENLNRELAKARDLLLPRLMNGEVAV